MAKVKGKKQWYQIMAPSIFNGKVVGDVTLADPSTFVGKVFSVNLSNITNDMRKQNTNMIFKATEVKGGKIETTLQGYELVAASIKRLVRRGRSKVSSSFVCKTLDGVTVRVKPIAVTRFKVGGSIARGLYKHLVESVARKLSKSKFDDFVDALINQKFHGSIKDELKKVYPLKFFDIKSVKIEVSKKGLKNVVVAKEAPQTEKKEKSKSKKQEFDGGEESAEPSNKKKAKIEVSEEVNESEEESVSEDSELTEETESLEESVEEESVKE